MLIYSSDKDQRKKFAFEAFKKRLIVSLVVISAVTIGQGVASRHQEVHAGTRQGAQRAQK